MTAYFDERHAELRRIEDALRATKEHSQEWHKAWEQLEKLEERVVWDVSICAEMPGFPADLAEEMNRVILRRALACQPLNNKARPEPEDVFDHTRLLYELIWDLHTVFHNVACRHLDHFSDSPLTPLRVLYARAEEKREAMVQGPAQEQP